MTKKRMDFHRPVTDAFGVGSPNWNAPFPNGNLTAAEIIAYFPHWLKSVDVIDRFVMNGANARIIAKMVAEYRILPDERKVFPANSVFVMMKDAMRRAGFENWVLGEHRQTFDAHREWNISKLSVTDFRTPRITHPKANRCRRNDEVAPFQFRDLTLHLKKHPTGADALDLTRCVLHAEKHPNEDWLYPTDFQKLVNRLGGTCPITFAHWDVRIFNRRSEDLVAPLHHHPHPQNPFITSGSEGHSELVLPPQRTRSKMKYAQKKKGSKGKKNTVAADSNTEYNISLEDTGKRTRDHHAKKHGTVVDMVVFQKQSGLDMRVRQIRNKTKVNYQESKSEGTNSAFSTPTKDKDQDWMAEDDDSKESEDLDFRSVQTDRNSDIPSPSYPRVRTRAGRANTVRRAAKEAKRKLRATQAFALAPIPRYTRASVPKTENEAVRSFPIIQAVFLKPLPISPERTTIDAHNVILYAEEGTTDPWTSAMDCYRFGGPRRQPPWRELHRLNEPYPVDVSDWAENIRWAKQQWKLYGSVWTEYEHSLEVIKEHRRAIFWASEELINSGKYPG